MGIEVLNEEQYINLLRLGVFDQKHPVGLSHPRRFANEVVDYLATPAMVAPSSITMAPSPTMPHEASEVF